MSTIIKIKDLPKKVGLSRSSIYRLVRLGQFPTPIKLSERSSGWFESEIDQWLADKATNRNNAA